MVSKELPIFDEIRGVMVTEPENEFAGRYVNLADLRLGAKIVHVTDEFFAPAERMLNPAPAIFTPGKYDDHGKWMDGWETRRKRVEGYDYCILRLGFPGMIRGIDIDTTYFTGNFPPGASIDACGCGDDPNESAEWSTLLAAVPLKGNSHHLFPIQNDRTWTHLRLNLYPDGGVARLRVYGVVQPNFEKKDHGNSVDLAAVASGGRLVGCSDQHYGTPLGIIFPGLGLNMAEGWETHRRREPGNEWALFALGHRGHIQRIELDTTHFKGNYPDRCSIQAADVAGGSDASLITQSMFWRLLLPEKKLEADMLHVFTREVIDLGAVTHFRLNVIPDGGINRLRMFGTLT